jgi:hypothetical protein
MAKAKKFDCVEMKRRAQERLLAEYEVRKHEFSSFGAFLNATVLESPWASKMWKRGQRRKPTRAGVNSAK